MQLNEGLNHIGNNQCIDWKSTDEKRLWLSCGKIHCGKYTDNYAEEHWLFALLTDEHYNIGHCLIINLENLSVWFYLCKSFMKNIRLYPLMERLESIKLSTSPIKEN